MSIFEQIGNMFSRRRTRQHTEHLRHVAEEHLGSRPNERIVNGPEDVPYGELVLHSGVSAARERAAQPYCNTIDKLAKQHATARGHVIENTRLIADLPAREHRITAKGHRPAKVFHLSPDLAGDSAPTTSIQAEHDALDKQICDDRANGETRHRNGVSLPVRALTVFLLFVDVVALTMIMIPAENTSLDLKLFTGPDAILHISRMTTAIALSLLGAGVLAVISHILGDITWARIHRPTTERAHTNTDNATATHRFEWITTHLKHDPLLFVGWAMLLLISLITGVTMFFRLSHSVEAAVESIGSATGSAIAFMIAVMAMAGPICVAVVSALAPSPEVLRRNALANILVDVDRKLETAREAIDAAQIVMANSVTAAGQVLNEAQRAVLDAGMPAIQAIIEMRARYGYAGDLHTALGSVPSSADTGLFDTDPLSRARAVIDTMCNPIEVADRPAAQARVTHRIDNNSDATTPSVVEDTSDARTSSDADSAPADTEPTVTDVFSAPQSVNNHTATDHTIGQTVFG